MYMADFPILKWLQVDGRSVSFTYPQHQKGNGYVITGEDNPLPTGNHVMTESGIWVPQRGTEEGAAHTQLTGSNIEKRTLFSNVQITPGSEYSSTIIQADEFVAFNIEVRRSGGSAGIADGVQLIYKPRLFGLTLGSTLTSSITVEKLVVGSGRILSEIEKVYTNEFVVAVRNTGSDDRIFALVINLMKR